MNVRWAFREWGHAKGSCVVHDDAGIIYLNVPKCASTTLKRYLEPLGFRYDDTGDFVKPAGAVAFTVVREPLDRWVSALLQYLRDVPGDRDAQLQVEAAAILAFERPLVHDPHAIPQMQFLDSRIPCNYVFPMGPNLKDLVDSVLMSRGITPTGDLPVENTTASTLKQRVYDVLEPEHRRILDRFYADDIVLWGHAMDQWTGRSAIDQ